MMTREKLLEFAKAKAEAENKVHLAGLRNRNFDDLAALVDQDAEYIVLRSEATHADLNYRDACAST